MLQHHAFLLYGDKIATSLIPSEFKAPSIDVTHTESPTLSIDDVRALIKDASSQPLVAPLRTFVICAGSIAHEAQHALLKVLEEPPASAQFYFILPKTAVLLPTLRSRFSFDEHTCDAVEESEVGCTFFSLPYSERIALVALKTKEKDTLWIDEVLQSAELRAQRSKNKSLLKAVLEARVAERSRGASMKMVLEDLALSSLG